MDDKNLMNFEGLSDVAIKLLDMIEKTVGWIALPKGAKADFNEGLRVYKEGILNDDRLSYIEKGIKISSASKELKEYMRQYKTIAIAINNLSKDAEPLKVDPDWINTLFSYVRDCSDNDMQIIWGQLLAEKINNKCDIPKRVLHIFSCIEKDDIETFCKLCSMTFDNLQREYSCYPFIYMKKYPSYYNEIGIRRYHLASLNNLGLIEYDIHGNFVLPKENPLLGYSKNKISLHNNSRISYGNVRFTQAGRALYKITKGEKNERFLEHCFKIWEKEKIRYTIE